MGKWFTFFMSGNWMYLASYGSPSSSRIMTVFQGFGPSAWEYSVMGLSDSIFEQNGFQDGNLILERQSRICEGKAMTERAQVIDMWWLGKDSDIVQHPGGNPGLYIDEATETATHKDGLQDIISSQVPRES